MAPWVGIEPTTNGLTVRRDITNYLNYQSLAALATPHSSHFKAQLRHSKLSLVTELAQR
jgi:putative addiction module CopG family antidote